LKSFRGDSERDLLDRYAGQSVQFAVGAASSQPKSFIARSFPAGARHHVGRESSHPVSGPRETGKDSFTILRWVDWPSAVNSEVNGLICPSSFIRDRIVFFEGK
jgi:hypothetical protein